MDPFLPRINLHTRNTNNLLSTCMPVYACSASKQEEGEGLVPLQELEAIRVRLAAHDETREAVIKVRV